MSSIEELFKPHLSKSSPSNPQKRKLDPTTRDASEAYKTAKVNANGDVKSQSYQKAQVEDEDVEDDENADPELPSDQDDGVEAGPSLEEDDGDDEEGRFFGGGVSKSGNAALNYLDAREEDGEEPAPLKIDGAWARRQAQVLDRRINKNSELRGKYEDDPSKFMASEADLDADIKACSILTDYSSLYTDFVNAGGVEKLVSLLAHENTDIAIDAMQVLSELTDEDVEAEQEQWDALVDAMLEADVLELITSNWERLDEKEEADRNGVYHSLALLESFASQASLNERVIGHPKIFDWLLKRIQASEDTVGQNKQYAAEILSIYAQSSTAAANIFIEKGTVDVTLQILAYYRKVQPPKETDEEEYVENLFDALTCFVDQQLGKSKFIEAEGIELIIIMLTSTKFAKLRALKVLDHAAATLLPGDRSDAIAVCERFVQAAGLKPLFALFNKTSDRASQAYILGVLASMLRLLPGNSDERIRTLFKWNEKDYRAITRLVTLRREYSARLAPVEERIRAERPRIPEEEREEAEDDFLDRRLDAGLFCVRTIDTILAWLVAEDEGAREKVVKVLAEQKEGLKDLKATLVEIRDGMAEPDPEPEEGEGMERDMLDTLLEFLE